MDSRIREVLEEARHELACGEANRDTIRSYVVVEKIDALLTVEPEPCESKGVVGRYPTANEDERSDGWTLLHEFLRRVSHEAWHSEEGMGAYSDEETEYILLKAEEILGSSQVADKRVEELRAQVETLREFVAEAVQWSEAYPEHIFTAPTPEQVDAVCKTLGFRIDRIAAMVLREFTGRWSNKARSLLAATEPKPQRTIDDVPFEATPILKDGRIVGYKANLTPPTVKVVEDGVD